MIQSSPPRLDRRKLLHATATGLAALTISTPLGVMSPREAQAAQTSLATLTADEAATLEAFAETLVPGATEAGVSRFVDAQLGSEHPLFMLRYLDFNGDYTEFYRGSLAAIESLAQARFVAAYPSLSADQQASLIGEMLGGAPEGWTGPPSFLVYFAIRNDATDVTFGTPEGFAALGIPYLAHIEPPEGWS
jgi:hypothetical protein